MAFYDCVRTLPNTQVTRENITHTDNGDTATEGANAPQINSDTALIYTTLYADLFE